MLRRSLLATFVTLIAGALAPSIPVAAGPDPAEFMNNLAYQLQVVARNTSPAERQAGFRELFDEDFDVPSIGRFVLGRLSQIMTAQEQQEFLGLFENYVVVTYSDRLSQYVADGAVPRVIGSRLDPDGAIVSSEFSRARVPLGAGAKNRATPVSQRQIGGRFVLFRSIRICCIAVWLVACCYPRSRELRQSMMIFW